MSIPNSFHPRPSDATRRWWLPAALLLAFLTCFLQAYEAPANWELRTHANGEIYYLYIPTGWEQTGSYPLVLGLHGCCWDGVTPGAPPPDPIYSAFHDFDRNHQAEPTFIVAPYSTNAWINKADRVMAILDSLRTEFPIDPQRLIVTGFSMGGAGGIEYINRYPNTFAGAILVAAALNNTAGLTPAHFRDVPIWGGAGTNDGWMTTMSNAFAFLRQANGYEAAAAPEYFGLFPRYSIFTNAGHGDAMEALLGMPEVVEWALALRRDGNATPMVRFTAPTPEAGQMLPEATTSITLAAEAVDHDGAIASVEFFVDGVSVGRMDQPPYQITIDNLAPGDHQVRVLVKDNGKVLGYARDKFNEDRRVISIQAPLAIATVSLPPARVGEFYRFKLQCSGLNGLDTWSQLGSPKLPASITLSASGVIEGVFDTVGSHTFTARVLDSKKSAVTRSLTVQALAPRPRQPVLTGLRPKNSRVVLQPWLFAAGEPYGTAGYGLPGGSYKRQTHPRFDGFFDCGALEGVVFVRVLDNGVAIDSTDSDWITFTSDIPVRVHVAYPKRPNAAVPAWLGTLGFVQTGQSFVTYKPTFIDYARNFPAGLISLGGNEGLLTGATDHYCLIVEPASEYPREYPWETAAWSGQFADAVSTWMGQIYLDRANYPWIFHDDHGWLAILGEDPASLWWQTLPTQFWWTSQQVYPWLYKWNSGWWYYLPGTRQPAWYYDFSNATWLDRTALGD